MEERELLKAFERVSKAVEGMPKTIEEVEIEDDLGGIDVGMKIPLAKVRAGDSKRLCMAVPEGQRSPIVAALLKGTRSLDPTLVVQQQSTCLNHLLTAVKPYLPAEPTPAPEQPNGPTESSDGSTGNAEAGS